MTQWLADLTPVAKARIAGFFYLLNFVSGAVAAFFVGAKLAPSNVAATCFATVCYLIVTLLFYEIFKPVSQPVSLLAALFSVLGCLLGVLNVLHVATIPLSSLVLFGVYCLLIGFLILPSTFLPRALGVLMAIGGISWLIFLSAPLARHLYPNDLAPSILGEGALTLWLLVAGLNSERWYVQARGSAAPAS